MNQNEERLAFYHAIGLAVTQWSHVEFALASIVGSCFGKSNRYLSVNGFHSIENFRSKLRYVDAIVSRQSLPAIERANWSKLIDRAARLSKKRNILAHYWVLNDTTTDRAGRRIMLLPSQPTTKNRKQRNLGAVFLRDVEGYRLEFSALMCSLENFECRLFERQERFPKSQEQPSRPPTLAKLRRQIYAFAQHPPRPSRK